MKQFKGVKMSMQKGLFSINALSVELDYDRRTLSKYLADLRPIEIKGKVKFYRLKEVLAHLEPLTGKEEKSIDPETRFEDFLQDLVPGLYDEIAPGLAFLVKEASDLPSDRIWKIFEEGYIYVYSAMAKALDCDQEPVKLKIPDLLKRLKDPAERKILINWLDSKKELK